MKDVKLKTQEICERICSYCEQIIFLNQKKYKEYPEYHDEGECIKECSCYEIIGGHQQGCFFYGKI